MTTPTTAIPDYVDSNFQLIWWEVDEVFPFLACFGAGIILEMMNVMLTLGVFMSYKYIRHKSVSLAGTLEHMAYWFGILSLNDLYTHGLEREYIE